MYVRPKLTFVSFFYVFFLNLSLMILLCLSFFRSGAISGLDGMGWDGLDGSLCGAIL